MKVCRGQCADARTLEQSSGPDAEKTRLHEEPVYHVTPSNRDAQVPARNERGVCSRWTQMLARETSERAVFEAAVRRYSRGWRGEQGAGYQAAQVKDANGPVVCCHCEDSALCSRLTSPWTVGPLCGNRRPSVVTFSQYTRAVAGRRDFWHRNCGGMRPT